MKAPNWLRSIGRGLKRVFGVVSRVVNEVSGPIAEEIRSTHARTDEQIRNIVERHVADYIARHSPIPAWVAEEAVELIVNSIRPRLRKVG